MATSATAIYYYHRDAVGSITDVTDTAGAAQWKYEYESFGAALTTTKVNNKAPVNQTGFTGEYQDPEWANYHLRARQYDPATSRFLATDPLAPALSDPAVSAYVYGVDRPSVFVDPSGLIATAAPPGFGVPDVIGRAAARVAPVARVVAVGVTPVTAPIAVAAGLTLWGQRRVYADANAAYDQLADREDRILDRLLALNAATSADDAAKRRCRRSRHPGPGTTRQRRLRRGRKGTASSRRGRVQLRNPGEQA